MFSNRLWPLPSADVCGGSKHHIGQQSVQQTGK
jgi:hypothetical protein